MIVFPLLLACNPKSEKPSFVCTDAIGCVTILPDEPIELGVIQALSGALAPNETTQLHTIEMVVSKRNNQLLGHPIILRIEDELCTSEGGANAALRVIADAGGVLISGSNSSASLTSIGDRQGDNWYLGYFRTVYNGAEEGWAAATFVSNAIKYSQPGKTIDVSVTCDSECVILQVVDHGIGIPDEDRVHIFDVFQRADNVGAIQGTGLGLAITKEAVELHGGTIDFKSVVGQGTTFVVNLPMNNNPN